MYSSAATVTEGVRRTQSQTTKYPFKNYKFLCLNMLSHPRTLQYTYPLPKETTSQTVPMTVWLQPKDLHRVPSPCTKTPQGAPKGAPLGGALDSKVFCVAARWVRTVQHKLTERSLPSAIYSFKFFFSFVFTCVENQLTVMLCQAEPVKCFQEGLFGQIPRLASTPQCCSTWFLDSVQFLSLTCTTY